MQERSKEFNKIVDKFLTESKATKIPQWRILLQSYTANKGKHSEAELSDFKSKLGSMDFSTVSAEDKKTVEAFASELGVKLSGPKTEAPKVTEKTAAKKTAATKEKLGAVVDAPSPKKPRAKKVAPKAAPEAKPEVKTETEISATTAKETKTSASSGYDTGSKPRWDVPGMNPKARRRDTGAAPTPEAEPKVEPSVEPSVEPTVEPKVEPKKPFKFTPDPEGGPVEADTSKSKKKPKKKPKKKLSPEEIDALRDAAKKPSLLGRMFSKPAAYGAAAAGSLALGWASGVASDKAMDAVGIENQDVKDVVNTATSSYGGWVGWDMGMEGTKAALSRGFDGNMGGVTSRAASGGWRGIVQGATSRANIATAVGMASYEAGKKISKATGFDDWTANRKLHQVIDEKPLSKEEAEVKRANSVNNGQSRYIAAYNVTARQGLKDAEPILQNAKFQLNTKADDWSNVALDTVGEMWQGIKNSWTGLDTPYVSEVEQDYREIENSVRDEIHKKAQRAANEELEKFRSEKYRSENPSIETDTIFGKNSVSDFIGGSGFKTNQSQISSEYTPSTRTFADIMNTPSANLSKSSKKKIVTDLQK